MLGITLIKDKRWRMAKSHSHTDGCRSPSPRSNHPIHHPTHRAEKDRNCLSDTKRITESDLRDPLCLTFSSRTPAGNRFEPIRSSTTTAHWNDAHIRHNDTGRKY